MRKIVWLLGVLALTSLACNLPPPSTTQGTTDAINTNGSSGVDNGTIPIVAIESPSNGAQSYIGSRIELRIHATDSIGITRVEIRESGRLAASQFSPDPSTDFTALLTYTPRFAGPVTIEAVAYRGSIVSTPVTLMLDIVNSKADLDNPSALDPTAGVSAGAICSARVNVNNLNLRNGPSTDFAVLLKLAVGEDLNVLGRNGDGTWYQVRRSDGTVGWVSAQYVNPNGDCTRAPVVQ